MTRPSQQVWRDWFRKERSLRRWTTGVGQLRLSYLVHHFVEATPGVRNAGSGWQRDDRVVAADIVESVGYFTVAADFARSVDQLVETAVGIVSVLDVLQLMHAASTANLEILVDHFAVTAFFFAETKQENITQGLPRST